LFLKLRLLYMSPRLKRSTYYGEYKEW